jgi:4-amino-4-deoxy-L-arabinose transferase-like glycosyltransferase
MANFRYRSLLYVLGFVLVFMLVYGIQDAPLRDYRETRLAEIGRELLWQDDWLVPRLNGSPFLDKPPLAPWLVALAFTFLGVTEEAARLPSVLSILWTALLVGWMVRRLFGRGRGILGTTLLLGAPGIQYYGRMLMSDTLAMACIFTAMVAFVEGYLRQQPRWYYLGFVVCGLGVLTRGLIGVVYPVGTLGAFLMLADRKAWKEVPWISGGLLFLLVTVPWFALIERQYPGFLELVLGQHHLERLLPHVNHPFVALPRHQILLSLAGFLGPMVFTLPGASGSVRSVRTTHRIPWLLALLVIGSVLLSTGRNHPYTLPALPPLVVLAAGWFGGLTDKTSPLQYRGVAALIGLCGGLLLGTLPWLGSLLYHLSPLLRSASTYRVMQVCIASVAGCFFLGSILLWCRQGMAACAALAAVMIPGSCMLTHVQHQLALQESRATLARLVAHEVQPSWPLIIADPRDRLFEGTGGWRFYAHRQVFMVAFEAPHPAAFQGAPRPAWILDMEDLVNLWRSARPFALVATTEALERLPLGPLPPPHARDAKFGLWILHAP